MMQQVTNETRHEESDRHELRTLDAHAKMSGRESPAVSGNLKLGLPDLDSSDIEKRPSAFQFLEDTRPCVVRWHGIRTVSLF